MFRPGHDFPLREQTFSLPGDFPYGVGLGTQQAEKKSMQRCDHAGHGLDFVESDFPILLGQLQLSIGQSWHSSGCT